MNVTPLNPCVVPKWAPEMVTTVPTGPIVGDTLVIIGPGVIVIVAVAVFVGSATELAVRITVGGFGTVAGAW